MDGKSEVKVNPILPAEMHAKAMMEDSQTPQYDMSFFDYVMMRLNNFSGNNYIPRVVCSILTKEYIIIAARPKCCSDELELPEVAERLKKKGYYVDVEDDNIARLSNTMSMLICWDPLVSTVVNAKGQIADPKSFNLYMTAMQYIRAEEAMSELPVSIKEELVIEEVYTKKWVSIALVSETMRQEALIVGDFLWDKGYYVGIERNARRENTWTMFISWDHRIAVRKGEHAEDFAFNGRKPESWT